MSSKFPSLELPATTASSKKKSSVSTLAKVFGCLALLTVLSISTSFHHFEKHTHGAIPPHAKRILRECAALRAEPGPPLDFAERDVSDRFVPGTKPYLLQNATIWTGGEEGEEVIHGDVLIEKGIIKAVGYVPESLVEGLKDLVRLNVREAWVTPGINDLHSHIGVDSVPELRGASDTNSIHGITQPWLRSLDGLNSHDAAYELSISGGVTSALVLPGSADAIGGQAFVIKLRPTAERTPSSKVLEPPYSLDGTEIDPSLPPRWRHMKHACGENPSRVYGGTRMDTIWSFRAAYNEARKVKEAQDSYCAKAEGGLWNGLDSEIPQSLQWEALVDVLRGRVKVNIHCYESVDFDGIVRLSNEFKFPVAAFHHAHEAYLVPDLLKQTYGGAPGVAMFATNARYKREAFRGSEFAARILSDHGIRVVLKSDHPVLNSRFLLHEAAQASYYGLNPALAIAAVTSTPAELAGFGHRLGYIKKGYDADIVAWDSHPLALGATPRQVWIDGIPQFETPFVSEKPLSFQEVPHVPNFDKESEEAVKYEGLPPLAPKKKVKGTVVFGNVKNVWGKDVDGNVASLFSTSVSESGVVVVEGGKIKCSGHKTSCASFISEETDEFVDLHGGSLSPGLVSYGSPLGLVEITQESSTQDGNIYDALKGNVPKILTGVEVQAVDGLEFGTRNAYLAYRSGVTLGISPPESSGFFGGLSTAFSLGAAHKLEQGAVVARVTALHVRVGHYGPSVSTQISTLRRLLLSPPIDDDLLFEAVALGAIPLVIDVSDANHIASLLELKAEVEATFGSPTRWTFARAIESHLLAKEIAEAGVSVILTPSRPFPERWDERRVVPGPPLTQETTISILLKHNVTVAIGIVEEWQARNTRLDLAWAALEADGQIGKEEAIGLASTSLEKIFGLQPSEDFVVYERGDLFDLESKVVAVISSRTGAVDLF